MALEALSRRCRAASLGDVIRELRERLPPELADRYASSLERLASLLAEAGRHGSRILGVALFGSIVDPSKKLRRDSDIDVLIVYEGRDPTSVIGEQAPSVVRLKRLPDGSIDAHTQYLDVENGVLWHPITAKPGELGEKLGFVKSPCVVLTGLQELVENPI